MKHRPKWFASRLVLGAALSIATVSFAFFLVSTFSAEGEHTGQTGAAPVENHALPLTVAFPDGLTPSNPVPLTLEVKNTASQAVELAGPRIIISTPTDPICGEEWLEAYPENANGETNAALAARFAGTNMSALTAIPANSGPTNVLTFFNSTPKVTKIWLRFKPSLIAGTDQTACAAVPIKVVAKLTKPTE